MSDNFVHNQSYDPSRDCTQCAFLKRDLSIIHASVAEMVGTVKKLEDALNGFVDKRGALGAIEQIQHDIVAIKMRLDKLDGTKDELTTRLISTLDRVENKLNHNA